MIPAFANCLFSFLILHLKAAKKNHFENLSFSVLLKIYLENLRMRVKESEIRGLINVVE